MLKIEAQDTVVFLKNWKKRMQNSFIIRNSLKRTDYVAIINLINFNKLNELIEDTRVCSLNISNTSNIFIEIKSMFISILESDLNVINNWKYKNTFLYYILLLALLLLNRIY